jgi:hypothetical protein
MKSGSWLRFFPQAEMGQNFTYQSVVPDTGDDFHLPMAF